MSATTSIEKDVSLEIRNVPVRQEAENRPPEERMRRPQRVHTARLSMSNRVLTVVPPLMLAVILLVSWYASTVSGHVSSLFLPAPGDVLSSLSDNISSGVYLSNTLFTIEESMLGFLLALLIALPLGYGIAKSRLLAATLQPYLAAGQAIPAIVIAPLLYLWLGYGLPTNIVICMLVVLFPLVINTILGIETIETSLTDAARVEGASGWSLIAYIEFPLALPAILAAVRAGFTLSIVGALVAEFVGGDSKGLGGLVSLAKNQYNSPFMFSTLLVLAALAACYYSVTWLLVKLAERVY